MIWMYYIYNKIIIIINRKFNILNLIFSFFFKENFYTRKIFKKYLRLSVEGFD